jgi:hypothetical protein
VGELLGETETIDGEGSGDSERELSTTDVYLQNVEDADKAYCEELYLKDKALFFEYLLVSKLKIPLNQIDEYVNDVPLIRIQHQLILELKERFREMAARKNVK